LSSTSPATHKMYTGKLYADMEVTVVQGPLKQNYGAVMDTSISKDDIISVIVHIGSRMPPCVVRLPENQVLERLYAVRVNVFFTSTYGGIYLAQDYPWPKHVGYRRVCGIGL
jgi:hypothetical protein